MRFGPNIDSQLLLCFDRRSVQGFADHVATNGRKSWNLQAWQALLLGKKNCWLVLNSRYIAAFVFTAFVRDVGGHCQTGTAKKRISSPPRFPPFRRLAQRYMLHLVERKTCTPAHAHMHGTCSTQTCKEERTSLQHAFTTVIFACVNTLPSFQLFEATSAILMPHNANINHPPH